MIDWNFDDIRNWIKAQPASPKIRRARLILFDRYRYEEEYEKIFKMIKDIKGQQRYPFYIFVNFIARAL